jgi:hypothetical protein
MWSFYCRDKVEEDLVKCHDCKSFTTHADTPQHARINGNAFYVSSKKSTIICLILIIMKIIGQWTPRIRSPCICLNYVTWLFMTWYQNSWASAQSFNLTHVCDAMDDGDDVYCLFRFTLHTHIYLNEFQNKDFDYGHMIPTHNMDHMLSTPNI